MKPLAFTPASTIWTLLAASAIPSRISTSLPLPSSTRKIKRVLVHNVVLFPIRSVLLLYLAFLVGCELYLCSFLHCVFCGVRVCVRIFLFVPFLPPHTIFTLSPASFILTDRHVHTSTTRDKKIKNHLQIWWRKLFANPKIYFFFVIVSL